WPDLPSACSTAFQSGGAAWAAAGLPNRATNSATMTSSITRSLMVPPSDPLRLLLQHRVQPVEDRHTLRQELVIVRRRLGERPDGQVDAGRLVSGELAVAQVGLVHDLGDELHASILHAEALHERLERAVLPVVSVLGAEHIERNPLARGV